MTNENRLHRNSEQWAIKNPKAALMLPYVDYQHIQFAKTEKGEDNLKSGGEFFHDPHDAEAEAKKWFESLDLNRIQILYVYGVGLGYYAEAASEWLRNDSTHHLVFLEDNLAVIHRLFETKRGTDLLNNPQIHLYYFQSLEDSTQIFDILYWNFVNTDLKVSALNLYKIINKSKFEDLEHKIYYEANMKNAILDEYLKYGVGFYKNFYPNMLFLPGSYLGTQLYGKFYKVPAIICGAGPSLAKHVHLLSGLKNKALIFAGGSAMNALNSAHVEPHFGVGIDPNVEQYKRLSDNKAYEVPFFYRNRMFHQAFQTIHGPRLYIPGGSGYDIPEWFEKNLDIPSETLDEGHNVINFCTQIAYHLGCSPIIFVGVDLAYTHEKQYAPGIVENVSLDKTNLLHAKDFEKEALVRTDIEGKPVTTLWKWVSESNWLGDFAKDHPDAVLINSTEGGLGFPRVPNQSFNEVVESYLERNFDLSGRVMGEIQNSIMPQIHYDKIVELMVTFAASLKRCQEYISALLEETEKIIDRLKNAKEGDEVSLQTGRAALCETELADEPGYKYVLEVLNLTISLVLTKELDQLEADKHLNEFEKRTKKLMINNKKLTFLKDAADFNCQIIKLTLSGEILSKDGICKPTNIHLKTK